jgi:inward rectifier potassium channel
MEGSGTDTDPGRRKARPGARPKQARVRIGQFAYAKKGVGMFDFTDPYHLAVTLSWPQFIALLLGTYLGVNLLFAVLYAVVPGSVVNARPHSVADAFFFSFETLATVGYGEMYPGSLYGHLVACAEIVTGLGFTAIMTGLTFVRFSRPRAKFLMAENFVVCQHNGQPTLMARIGNGRATAMADAKAQLHVLVKEVTAEGANFRRVQELRLLRARLPLFPLTWTLMHVLDEKSPLQGMTAAQMVANEVAFFLTIEARDPTLATVVHEMRTYTAAHVVFGMRYVDVITIEADGTPMADMTLLSATEPDVGPERQTGGWSDREPGDLDAP